MHELKYVLVRNRKRWYSGKIKFLLPLKNTRKKIECKNVSLNISFHFLEFSLAV